MSQNYEYSIDQLSIAGPWTSSAPIDCHTYRDTRDYDKVRCNIVPGVSLDRFVKDAEVAGQRTLLNYSAMLRGLAARARDI